MLKRTAIRALCNTTAYQRGLDIYRTGKRIQSLDIKSEGAVDKISAAVKGSGRNVYNTGFQYDTEADRIKEAYCDCPAFRSYSGICKHCVAVLLEYGDRKAYERVEIRRQQDEEQKQAESFSGTAFPAALSGPGQPATKTTVELKSLLNRQLYSRMLPFSGDPYFGRVELETCLKFNSVRNCFTVEFRVGCEKNISSRMCWPLCGIWIIMRRFLMEKIWNLSIQMKPFQKDPEACWPLSGNGSRIITALTCPDMNS